MAFADIRKFNFQTTDGDIYEVALLRTPAGAVNGVGRKIGVATDFESDPSFDKTEVSFVVLTSAIGRVFGPTARLDAHLAMAAIYDASNPGAGGAALSTLLT